MEGGQKIPVNLTAGLDVSSSDMLVPFNQQTLQHNWQKWQGKCLPNSLRFEMNGWAAGWNVYNFEYDENSIEVNGKWFSVDKLNECVFAVNMYDSADMSLPVTDWHVVTDYKVLSGPAQFYTDQITGEVKLRGRTNEDTYFDILWNASNNTASITPDNMSLQHTIKSDVSYFDVVDMASMLSVEFDVALASELTCDSLEKTYQYVSYDGQHIWQGGYALDLDHMCVSVPEAPGITIPITSQNVSDNRVTLDFNVDVVDQGTDVFSPDYKGEKLDVSLFTEPYYVKFTKLRVKNVSDSSSVTGVIPIASDIDDRLTFNNFKAFVSGEQVLSYDASAQIDTVLPVWFTAGLKREYLGDIDVNGETRPTYRIKPFAYQAGVDVTGLYNFELSCPSNATLGGVTFSGQRSYVDVVGNYERAVSDESEDNKFVAILGLLLNITGGVLNISEKMPNSQAWVEKSTFGVAVTPTETPKDYYTYGEAVAKGICFTKPKYEVVSPVYAVPPKIMKTGEMPKIAFAVAGYMSLKMSYPKIVSESEATSGRIHPIFEIEQNDSVQHFKNKHLLMVDRDDAQVGWKKLFSLRSFKSSDILDDRQEGGGVILTLASEYVDNNAIDPDAPTKSVAKMYYAEKRTEYVAKFDKDVDINFAYYLPSEAASSSQTLDLDTDHVQGRLSPVQQLQMKVTWVPLSVKLPTTATPSFVINNPTNSSHKLYSRLQNLSKAVVTVSKDIYANVNLSSAYDGWFFKKITVSNLFGQGVCYGYYGMKPNGSPAIVKIGTQGLSNINNSNVVVVSDANSDWNAETVSLNIADINNGSVGSVSCSEKLRLSDKDNEHLYIKLDLHLRFHNFVAQFYKLTSANLFLARVDNDILTIRYAANKTLEYSAVTRKFYNTGVQDWNVSGEGDLQRVNVTIADVAEISALMPGVYGFMADAGSFDSNSVSLRYDNAVYNISAEFIQNANTKARLTSVDIRDPDKVKQLGMLDSEGQYQLLKQVWNTTVEVENYWWVDARRLLELNSTSFVLKRNTGKLHDWNGNIFEDIWSVPRHEILPTSVRKHFMSNVYGSGSAVLCCVSKRVNGVHIDVRDARNKFDIIGDIELAINHRELGKDTLNEPHAGQGNVAKLNTYGSLGPETLLSKAEWSCTRLGQTLIIGCHASNNFDQWAIVVELNEVLRTCIVQSVIQGYGYVGLHGELTGGMIPNDYFDASLGFNGIVCPLSSLDCEVDKHQVDKNYEVKRLNRLNDIDNKVVGNAEQQWYIRRRLHGIVSHLTYDNGGFTKHIVPLTNNYASMYASPSFYSSVLGDCLVQVSQFADMANFPGGLDTLWRTFCGFVGWPMLYSLAPRFSSLCYLQQSFGQYAYVHYNSSKSMPEPSLEAKSQNEKRSLKDGVNPLLSSEFIFDKQKVTQMASTDLNYFAGGIIGILTACFGDTVSAINRKISINEEQNQSAIADLGRKYVENVSENASNMLASAIVSNSKSDIGVVSVVSGVKSLDMFYSTSDSQRVFAGPGFVEQQYVADCIAQSVTDTQVEGKVNQMFMCLRALSEMQARLMICMELAAADMLEKVADKTKEFMICANNVGAIVAAAMSAAASALRIATLYQRECFELFAKMLDSICANGITVSVDGQVSRHALSVEGKHKYGEKNEVFMWPCWGIKHGELEYTDESVDCGVKNTPWSLTLRAAKYYTAANTNAFANILLSYGIPNMSSNKMRQDSFASVGKGGQFDNGDTGESNEAEDTYRAFRHEGLVPFYQVAPFGVTQKQKLPDDMAKIEGVSRFLPSVPFKNENISVSDPAFAPSLIHDYILDKAWDLSQCASYGKQQWVTVKDTKITNCPPSNMIVTDAFCGVACQYTAVELRRGVRKAYMRPWAITPNALAFNCTGINTVLDDKLYHSFDGISLRLVDLVGAPGMGKNNQSFLYALQVNDRFKRSNILPAQEMQGNFESEPALVIDSIDPIWVNMTISAKEKGLEAGTIGEDKDAVRWAIPVFTEQVSTLPACVKTMTAAVLAVVDGVTGLVTAQVTDTNAAYKAPVSVDFNIGKNVYRATEEYICSVTPAEGGNIITNITPSLGLKFIGSTPTEAYFYSQATRCYYMFTGAVLVKVDMMERFRDIQRGYWDFVNQEVVMPCLMTYKRLNPEVEDTDTETDNIIVPVLSKGQVSGELPPPLVTVFNDRSWYKCVSLPAGFAYQGPNRVIINRAIFVEYMLGSLKKNLGKWKKLPREKYSFNREYMEKYSGVVNSVDGVNGWTHNPFLLVTSAFGTNENTDCLFEWEITFCWPIEMDLLYGPNNYACVNITADTMTQGGQLEARPTHVFLKKELFTRDGNYGYYSFRYQSKNGVGNRERLKIWSDQYIAVSSVVCECKAVSQKRTEQLTQQVDVQGLEEL